MWNQSDQFVDPAKPEMRQLIFKTWNLEPFLPADCSECREQLIHLFPWVLARDPNQPILPRSHTPRRPPSA
jgi:hypothetical protein